MGAGTTASAPISWEPRFSSAISAGSDTPSCNKTQSAHHRNSQRLWAASQIARLACHFYETRGRRDGQDVDDWLSAERELTHQYR